MSDETQNENENETPSSTVEDQRVDVPDAAEDLPVDDDSEKPAEAPAQPED